MTRHEAALLLGVAVDADPVDVRRAWRVWARLGHPDAGGDPEFFRSLVRARDTLLEGTVPEPVPMPDPAPRIPFRQVCCKPSPAASLVLGLLVMLALGISMVAWIAPPWIGALAMGATGTAVAVGCSRAMLDGGADVGHRIGLLVAVWLPLSAIQIVLAGVFGAGVLVALPALALPFVVAVALVNPGAGLWRPVAG